MNRTGNWAHGIMCALVALYVVFVGILSLGHTLPLPLCAVMVIALFFLLRFLSKKLTSTGFTLVRSPQRFSPRVFLGAAGLCALILLIYLAGYYPGGYSSDTVIQWLQALWGSFSDHHPALHTMILALLMRICNHPVFVLGVQLLAYALCVGYACAVLARWGFPRKVYIAFAAALSLSPGIDNIMLFLWKDCLFAVCVLALAVMLLEIHLSCGEWLCSIRHSVYLVLMLCLCSILRHNGPALTLPAGIWLLISQPRVRRRITCTLLCTAALFVLIHGPLYSALQVTPRPSGMSETFGAPMAVLTHIYAEAPDALDEDIVTYLNCIAPWETYFEHDAVGDWNEVKWVLHSYDVSNYTLADVFRFALRASIAHPQLAVEALAGLWQMPLLPFGDAYWRVSPYVDDGFLDYWQLNGIPLVERILGALCRYSAMPACSWLFWNPGFPLLLVMLACALFGRSRPLSALTLPAMLICYHLVTCLVLSSSTDYRFFLSTPMIAPLCLLGLSAKPRTKA